MSSKNQSVISIGIGLLVIGAILLVFAFSEPKQPVGNLTSVPETTVSDNRNTDINAADESYKTNANTQAVPRSSTNTADSKSNYENPPPVAVTYPINLNTCTQQELMSINGIGESRASAIIQYREHIGGYTSTEQIKDIKGFGDSLYQKIAPYITV